MWRLLKLSAMAIPLNSGTSSLSFTTRLNWLSFFFFLPAPAVMSLVLLLYLPEITLISLDSGLDSLVTLLGVSTLVAMVPPPL